MRVESFKIDDKIYNDEKIEENVPYILDNTKRHNFEISVNSKLDSKSNVVSSVPQINSLSAEDQREIEEVRRLASGGSSSNEWDD